MEMNNMNELEQMREQMQMLRNKLDKQEIINDKMLRRSIKKEMSWIKIIVYIEFLLIPVIALVLYGMKEMFGLSWWNCGFVIVTSIIDVTLDYYVNVASLKIKKGGEYSLTETMQKLISMKQIRAKQFHIMITLSAAWVVWACIEMRQFFSSIPGINSIIQVPFYGGMKLNFSVSGIIIGVFLGFFIAIWIYRRMQRANDELISQLKEVSENE